MFHGESKLEEHIEHIEKMLKNMPKEIEQGVDSSLDPYRIAVTHEDVLRLMASLRESLEVLLYRKSGDETSQRAIQSLIVYTDRAISELPVIVGACSKALEEIRTALYEKLEQRNDF